MNTKLTLLSSVFLTLLMGCGRQEQTTAAAEPDPAAKAPAAEAGITFSNGMTLAAFQQRFGEPKGELINGSKEWLLYDGFEVSQRNGTVRDLPEDIDRLYAEHTKPSPLEKIKDVTTSIPAAHELKAALAKRKAFIVLNSQGEPVDHSDLVSTGKVTVVEFTSSGSADALRVSVNLNRMIEDYEDVELRQVDIGSWDSETARRYHVSSVPDIRILDAYGNLTAQPVTRIEAVDGHMDFDRVKAAIDKTR